MWFWYLTERYNMILIKYKYGLEIGCSSADLYCILYGVTTAWIALLCVIFSTLNGANFMAVEVGKCKLNRKW